MIPKPVAVILLVPIPRLVGVVALASNKTKPSFISSDNLHKIFGCGLMEVMRKNFFFKVSFVFFLCFLFFGLFSKSSFAATVTCPANYVIPSQCTRTFSDDPGGYARTIIATRKPEADRDCNVLYNDNNIVGCTRFMCFCWASVLTEYTMPAPDYTYCGRELTAPCYSSYSSFSSFYTGVNCCDRRTYSFATDGTLESACASYCATLSGGGIANPNQPCPTDYTVTDSYMEAYDANQTHGEDESLKVSWWGTGDIKKSAFKFDLSSGTNPVPAGATITSATLRVFMHGWAGNSCPAPNGVCSGFIDVYKLNRNWNENQLNWNRASGGNNWQIAGANGIADRDQTFVASSYVWLHHSTGYHTFDIKDLVQGWINNPSSNDGVILAPRKDEGKNNSFDIYSHESSVTDGRPCLMVEYTTPTPTPTSTPTPTPTTGSRAWFQTKDGDVHATGDIYSRLPNATKYFSLDGAGGFPGVVSYAGSAADFTPGKISTKEWLANTALSASRSYEYFYSLLGQPNLVSPPIGGEINESDLVEGINAYNGDIATPQEGWDISAKKVVVVTSGKFLAKGRTRVDTANGGSLLVLAKEGIGISKNVVATGGINNKFQGIYITDSTFYTSVDEDFVFTPADSNKILMIDGMVIANEFNLKRDFSVLGGGDYENKDTATETFRTDIALIMNQKNVWYTSFSWSEVAP